MIPKYKSTFDRKTYLKVRRAIQRWICIGTSDLADRSRFEWVLDGGGPMCDMDNADFRYPRGEELPMMLHAAALGVRDL